MTLKERQQQKFPNIGDTVFELDNQSNIIAEYKVNKDYRKDDYPELITVDTVKHAFGWFEPGENTIKYKEELLILRA